LNSNEVHRKDDRLHFAGYTPIMARGAGAGLSDTLFELMRQRGIELLYETGAKRLLIDSKGRVQGVTANRRGESQDIKSKAVILCCGGFESNPEWRARYLGKDWDLVKVRGTRYNMGDGLRMAMDIGAQPTGHWSGCHAIFIDADAPQPAIREETERTSKRQYIVGLVVNVNGRRFIDEGEDQRSFTYARFGQHVVPQPQRLAFQLFDSRVHEVIGAHSDYRGAPSVQGDTLEEIADELAIDPDALARTVKDFNEASKPGGFLKPHEYLGGWENRRALGISPPKSNCAFPLDTPPFYAYPICCGITFTFGGLKVNQHAQVLDTLDNPIQGLYAAGEIVGGLFYNNYPGATGQLTGVVYARIAGANAATD
jgi:tricarballylate dehydrogenase